MCDSVVQPERTNLFMKPMKPLLAVLLGLAATTYGQSSSTKDSSKSSATVPNPSYSLYSTNNYANSPPNSPLRKLTTAELQKERLDLYKKVPRAETQRGVPYYTYHGQPLPQQDQILAIEAELNRRFMAGDKAAALPRPIPGAQHPAG